MVADPAQEPAPAIPAEPGSADTAASAPPVDVAVSEAQPRPLPAFEGFTHPNDIPAPFAAPVEAPAAALSLPRFEIEPAAVSNVQQALPAMPAAMRPITLEAFESEAEDEPLASLLPPRVISRPNFTDRPAALQDAANETEDESDEGESFSSLLNLGRASPARQNFIRIEEPADTAETIEPVVIFPGQAARNAAVTSLESVRNADQAEGEDLSDIHFRRFDAPANAEAGQPVATPMATSHNVEDTEQALRAALANLQRMSGAA